MSARLDSPLAFIIDYAARQTDFKAEIPKSLLDRAPRAVARKVQKVGLGGSGQAKDDPAPLLVVREFERLHALSSSVSGGEGKGGELQAILLLFSALDEAVEAMLNDPGPKAMEFTSQLLKQEAGPLPEALRTIRRTLQESEFDKDARDALFEQPLRLVWGAILKEAQGQLNADWEKKVSTVFKDSLAGYYPFSPQGEGAALIDFGRFFSPQEGVIWKFIEEELKPFVKTESWSPIPWENQGIVLSQATVENLKKAATIKQGLFPQGNLASRFHLMPDVEPYTEVSGTRPVINNITISIDGRTDPYQMGNRRWQDFSWPGQDGPPAAALVVSTRQGELDRLRFDGEWGWFRLLEKAKVEEITSREYRLLWLCGRKSVNQVQIRYRLQADALVNPFRNMKDFFSFRCPERLD
jgi:type VI secretion system protein ImpL